MANVDGGRVFTSAVELVVENRKVLTELFGVVIFIFYPFGLMESSAEYLTC